MNKVNPVELGVAKKVVYVVEVRNDTPATFMLDKRNARRIRRWAARNKISEVEYLVDVINRQMYNPLIPFNRGHAHSEQVAGLWFPIQR